MKATTKFLSATALLSIVAAGVIVPVYAQETPAAPAPAAETSPVLRGPLAALDTDGDGTVTLAEVEGARAARIAEFDQDGTPGLSLEEYQALWLDNLRERMVDDFQRYDNDGDGIVTAEEFGTPAANLVARADRNGDGVVDGTDQAARGGREGMVGHGTHMQGPMQGGAHGAGPNGQQHGAAPGGGPGQGGFVPGQNGMDGQRGGDHDQNMPGRRS